MYKVLVLHQSAIFRNEFAKFLAVQGNLKIQLAVNDVEQAFSSIERKMPDLVLIQIDEDFQKVLKLLGLILQSHSNIIVLYNKTPDSEMRLQKVIDLGIRNFIALPSRDFKDYFINQSEQLTRKLADMVKLIKQRLRHDSHSDNKRLIVVGASMGGVKATETLLTNLPRSIAGMVIVQHMGAHMMENYAARLDSVSPLRVKVAEDGEPIQPGKVLLAPNECHTLIKRKGDEYVIKLQSGERIGHHMPAVDQLFRSTAEVAGKEALGIILTGMGEDGALGITMMHKNGASTIAQDEASSVVFGMPKAAIIYGGIDQVLGLEEIPAAIVKHASCLYKSS